MKYLKYLVGIVGVILAGVIGYFFVKDEEDTKTLADNKKVVDGLSKETTEIQNNNVDIAKQETVQNQLKSDIESTKNEDDSQETPSNVVSFFNNRK